MEEQLRPRPLSKVLVTYPEGHEVHTPRSHDSLSPEDPRRVEMILKTLRGYGRVGDGEVPWVKIIPGRKASLEDVLRVHSQEYIEELRRLDKENRGFVGDSTYICRGSFEAALRSAGTALEAADRILKGEASYAFALTRPPGHHAKRSSFGGFCLLNNTAVLVRYLQEVKKIPRAAVVNIDAHASNGTQWIFYESPSVLHISVHQNPLRFYPFEGMVHQLGRKSGRGYTVNIPMPPGSGDKSYAYIMGELIVPLLSEFNPPFIVLECGFDAHYSEKLTSLNLSENGYYSFIRRITEVTSAPIVVLLEGGYGSRLGKLSLVVLAALEGRANPFSSELVDLSRAYEESLSEVKEMIEELHTVLSERWSVFQTPRMKLRKIKRLLEGVLGPRKAAEFLSVLELERMVQDPLITVEDMVRRIERKSSYLKSALGESVAENVLTTIRRFMYVKVEEPPLTYRIRQRLEEYLSWHMEDDEADRILEKFFPLQEEGERAGECTPHEIIENLNALEKELVELIGWDDALKVISKARLQLIDEFRDELVGDSSVMSISPGGSGGSGEKSASEEGRKTHSEIVKEIIERMEKVLSSRIGDIGYRMVAKRFHRQRKLSTGVGDIAILKMVVEDVVEGVLFFLGPKESKELEEELLEIIRVFAVEEFEGKSGSG